MPEPMITPQRNGSSFEKSMPESATASMPATMANCVKRSIRFSSLAIDVAFGRPIVDVAAELHLVPVVSNDCRQVDAALAAQNPLPQVVDLAAERSNGAKAGDDDASFHR